MSLFDEIREAAAGVAADARFVSIDRAALERLAGELAEPAAEPAVLDPAHHHLGSEDETLAYVVTLDAINFGSGWFPVLRKRPGCSGYFTVATALKEHFEREGALDAPTLRALDVDAVTRMLGQEGEGVHPDVRELMTWFARALGDLGALLEERHGGSFGALVASADGRAEALVRELARMPCYRDVARHGEREVPLYKRAQLTAADLSLAFDGAGPGAFTDLAELTIFADNLVPHVLRCEGVLVYDPALGARIDAEERLDAGSLEETEIRAVGLHAVEEMVGWLRARGHAGITAQRLDYLLWNAGQAPAMKARPRHRARSVYY